MPAVTLPWAIDLIDRVGVSAGDNVLDVACGTGVVARAAAERVGRVGRVAGLDVNQDMLAVARSLPPVAGIAIEWRCASAIELPFTRAEFGIVLCQLGLQFMPDRAAALQEMARVLTPGGRLGLSVFAAIERNPANHALADALDRHVFDGASLAKRNEHSLGDVHELLSLMREAGFRDVDITTVVKTTRFASASEYVRIQLAATPLAGLLSDFNTERREDLARLVTEDVCARLAPFSAEGELAFPQVAHVVTARSQARP